MFGLPVASIITALPLVGNLFVVGIDNKNTDNTKLVAIWTTFAALMFSFFNIFAFKFDSNFINCYGIEFMKNSMVQYRTEIDSFAIFFVFIISLICFLIVLWIMKRDIPKTKNFYMSLLFFESFSIGSFLANDIFLLFMFMESTIVSMYIMMLSGNKNKNSDAIFQFLVYSLVSALIVLVAIIMIYLETKTSSLSEIYKIGIKNKTIFFLLCLGIAIKMPVWPLYHWLPTVHVKSPAVCSVLFAAVVLKFSTLLILRFINPLFFDMLLSYKDIIFWIVSISMLFATAQMMFQDDLKKVFAYFSIIHMNLYFLILLSGLGIGSFLFAIMQHSIVMALMFLICDSMKRILNTRLISELKCSKLKIGKIKRLIFIGFMALIGVPFSWGFISEIISVYAVSRMSFTYSCIIAFIILISSLYLMFIYQSVFSDGNNENNKDISLNSFKITDAYKKTVMFILFSILFIAGIFPGLILNYF